MESSAVDINRGDRGKTLAGRQMVSKVAGRQVTAWQVERQQSGSVAGQPSCAGLAPHTAACSLNLFIGADCMLCNPSPAEVTSVLAFL